MLRTLEGLLVEKAPARALVERDGLGWELFIPLSTYHALPDLSKTVKLFTHLHVREDALQLFGFSTREERELFELLQTVSGIGPKLALAILSGANLPDFKDWVIRGNVAALQSISGIGRKTAERLVVELREKLAVSRIGEGARGAPAGRAPAERLVDDSLNALITLGYTRQAALKAVKKAMDEQGPVENLEELIRMALKHV